MNRRLSFAVALLTALLSSASAQAQTFLTDDEMMQRIVGKTLSGLTFKGNEPWSAQVLPHKKGKPKGKMSGTHKGKDYTHSWKVKKGEWCVTRRNGTSCWQLEHVSDNEVRPWADGKATERVWRISE